MTLEQRHTLENTAMTVLSNALKNDDTERAVALVNIIKSLNEIPIETSAPQTKEDSH